MWTTFGKGASKDIKNNDGRTPEEEAKYWNAVAELIRDYPNHTKNLVCC